MPEKKLKKATAPQEEAEYVIQCTQPGAPKNACQLFQLNGKKFYVPFNKPVRVRKWVYTLWLYSKYNAANQQTDVVDPDHIVND